MDETWDEVDIIELLGLTEMKEEMEKKKLKIHIRETPLEMPDDWEVTKIVDFVRDRWVNSGIPIYRRCINEDCPIIDKYGEPAYWVICIRGDKVEVTHIDTHDTILYVKTYDISVITAGIYCPFCHSLGQLIYEKEIDILMEKFISFEETHNGDYDRFLKELESLKKTVTYDIRPPISRGMNIFEWRMDDKNIDLIKLFESKYIPPLDCQFKQCSYYESTSCDHLKCVIGEIIYTRMQSDIIIQKLLDP